MPVTKTFADRYTVRHAGEYAAIFMNEWSEPGGKEPRYLGEIAIHSSFGSWAYQWGACGMPFRAFLAQLDNGYLMNKLAGASAYVFDGVASMQSAFGKVLKARRRRELARDEARDLWDALVDVQDDAASGSSLFVYLLSGIEDKHGILDEPWYMVTQKENPQVAGFLRELWPEFVSAIQAEAPSVVPANDQIQGAERSDGPAGGSTT